MNSDNNAAEVIGGYKVHRIAALFPMMDDEAFDSLKSSIRQHGQQVPIVMQGDTLLDGRNRLRACLELKREPKIEQYQGALLPGEYIFQLNFERRDLTDTQRLDISLQADPLIREEAKARQSEGGKSAGRGRPKQLPIKRSEAIVIEIEEDKPKPPKKSHEGDTRKRLAEKAGVSERKAQQYLNVVSDAPELLEDVKKGVLPLEKAAKVAATRRHPAKVSSTEYDLQAEINAVFAVALRRFNHCPTQHRTAFKQRLFQALDFALGLGVDPGAVTVSIRKEEKLTA